MSAGWSFYNPIKVQFGVGLAGPTLSALPYRRMLLVTSAGMTRRGTTQWAREACRGAIHAVHDGVLPNPEMADLDELAVRHRAAGFDAIVALGGGSALDTAKILGVLLGTPADFTLRDHFIGNCAVPDAPALPVIAIPTTAGTGSEVTPFATVWDAGAVKKYSLSHPRMFPTLAIVDPEMTKDLPWTVTLATGLDALCQALESVWNRHANPITLGFAMAAVPLAWRALQQGEGLMQSAALRADLLQASLLAGLAISHTRTALCHSMSYPVTAKFGLAHGLACAFTMPAVLRFNAESDDGRLADVARRLGFPSVSEFHVALRELLIARGLNGILAEHSITAARLDPLVSEMFHPGRADNNLRPTGVADIRGILSETADSFPALR